METDKTNFMGVEVDEADWAELYDALNKIDEAEWQALQNPPQNPQKQ